MTAVPVSVSVGKSRTGASEFWYMIDAAVVYSELAVVRVTGDCMMQVWQM